MDSTIRRLCTLYTFVLLLLIVEATDTNNNETTQERRQSRVTGRIVKLYSGTRPEPILCAGEGFQADPRDCAVFYRCMKSGNGKFTVFRFQCGPGTVYDPDTEVCNHPRSTRRTECGGLLPAPPVDRLNNNVIEGAHNEIPSPITSTPILLQSTTVTKPSSTSKITSTPSSSTTKRQVSEVPSLFTNLYPWESTVGHTTMDYTRNPVPLLQSTATQRPSYTEASKIIPQSNPTVVTHSNSQDNICTSDGFMGDSENCRKFYRCVANQRGTYTRFEFSCSESTVWDDDTQSCNHAWAVKRSRCGRSNQNNNVATNTNTEIPQTDRTDKTIQQKLQISYGSKVTQTQTQISNGSVIQNQTQINFGDRLNQNKDTKAKQNQTQISHGSAISQTQTQIDYSNKAVQTQLQIDHSKQSSQSQTQIHESTTNGPSKSTQSSSNNVGNTCERSGFMGDANDCKKFYRCVDNGRGGYTKFEFSCGEGTVWDQTIEACNHAWAVKECGGKGPSGTTSTTQATASTSQSTQNYHTTASAPPQTTSETVTQDYEDNGYGQQNPNPTSSPSTTLSTTSSSTTLSTTSSSTTAKPPSNGNCQSSGFIGDPNDCKVFYRCVENGRGSFTKYEFKCGEGTVWDPDLEACNHAWAVKRCGGSASPDVSHTETTTEKQNIQLTTNTLSSTQSSSEMPATQNDDYVTGYGQNNNDVTTSSTSTTTTAKQPQNTGNICQSSGFMGDRNDCKKFYRCVDNGNGGFTRYEFTCGEGTVWDPKIEACNHAWAVENCGGSAGGQQESTTQSKPTTINEIVASSTTQSDQSTVSSTPLPSSTISTSTTAGSVPVASTDCKNSGFMGDPNDCKKFYRCVDNGKGSYTKYEFSCGEGTVWDQKIEACNHAWAVENCGGSGSSSSSQQESSTQLHPTMSDEIDNGYPSNIDTDSDTTTQSTTTHSTSEGPKLPSSGNNCVSSGFMGDKNNCKKFYRCVDNGNGGYTRYEFDCGEGTLWDQSIEACNHAWAVKDCGATSDNTVQKPTESSTQASSTTETEIGYPQSTEKTSTSTTQRNPESDTSEKCSKEGFVGDKNNCKKFYRCVDNGRGGYTKYEFTCGDGTYWNQEILSCDHATSDKTCGGTESSSSTQTYEPEHDEIYTESSSTSSSTTTERSENQTQKPQVSSDVCESEGFYGDKNDCKKFYRCVDNGKGGYTKYDFTCGEGTVWDQEIQACNHASSNQNCSYSAVPASSTSTTNRPAPVTDNSMTTASQTQHTTETTQTSSSSSSSQQCSSEGFFAVPNDCKKFIRCVSNDKGGYTKYEFSCGDGTVWVQDILACDHDTGDTNCSSQTTSRPATTEGNQQTTEKNEVSSSTTESQTIDKQEDEYDNTNSEKPPPTSSGQCTSEGFYGNENDCRQFYRCVDNGKGGYTKYDFTCGEGTAWDADVQTCNHIDQVKSCQGGSQSQPVMHDEDNRPTEASSTSSSSTTAASTSSSGTTVSSTSSSTTSSSESDHTTSANKDTCNSEGYFGNSQDCKKFYRCVDNGKGSYTKYDFTCGEGTIWDQDITTCNHPQDVANPSCNQQQDGSSSSSTESSPSSSSTPSDTTSTSSSSSSSSSTQSTTESSQSSSNCSQENSSKKPQNQNITCDKAGYYPNPNDCKKFYRCVDWDGDGKRFSVYHFECGEGTIWDPAVETCNHEESVYPPRDCSGSESQSANPPATEGTTTTQQETTSTQESTSTQSTSTSQSSTEQTTQSSTTESTTTEQSTTSEQTTTQQSTTSEQTTSSQTSQATTESSTTETTEQTTQSSSSSQTTTEQSTTSEQTTTQQSTTSEQTTTQSTTSEQTTQESTTSEQTTQSSTTTEESQQSTTEQSTTTEGTTEQSTTEQSTTEQSTTEQSTTEQSTTEQSTTEQSTTEQSTTEQSTTEQSTTEQSATEQSTTEQSTTEQSTTEQSTTEQSTTEQSTTEQSTTEQSTTEQSTTDQSTTEQSTTEQSTTEQSTTDQSTTEQSTTEQSTTEQSTTEQSTTEQSTTEQSNDNSTTESKCPETNEDQSLFVCPTSFRRHPKYCNLFYQCDEDDDTHDVKIAVFTCPNNTIYDESQTRCVEESKADKKCDGKIAQKRRFKRLDKNYKEPIVVTKESQACPGTGYFSFEKDSECSPAFLKCKKDKRNVIRGLVYRCPKGYVYWSISKRCEPVDSVRDCKRSQNNWSGRWEIPVERRNVAPS
uniref:SFRICE_028671 n=1 Tax=Spodoptera frugiperda TaxID=7108 RepID=A0A2H1VY42_SPOFR